MWKWNLGNIYFFLSKKEMHLRSFYSCAKYSPKKIVDVPKMIPVLTYFIPHMFLQNFVYRAMEDEVTITIILL